MATSAEESSVITSSIIEQSAKRAKVEMSEIKNILILIAMEAEAAPLIKHLSLALATNPDPNVPALFYTGVYKNTNITVATNGKCNKFGVDNVGTVPAALTAYVAISQFKPDIVLNAGTAGGFKAKGGAIGDVYISSKVANHDRRIPIPGFTEYGIGSYSSASVVKIVEELNYKTGVVSTSNSLDHTEMDDTMMLQNDASVKDMEAAAIAWTAELFKKPFLALKVVTDLVDGGRLTQDEFLENLAAASASLQAAIPRVLDGIIGKSLADFQ